MASMGGDAYCRRAVPVSLPVSRPAIARALARRNGLAAVRREESIDDGGRCFVAATSGEHFEDALGAGSGVDAGLIGGGGVA